MAVGRRLASLFFGEGGRAMAVLRAARLARRLLLLLGLAMLAPVDASDLPPTQSPFSLSRSYSLAQAPPPAEVALPRM
ncbi:hypothetical protein MRX96_026579 [Rhipicephalus microplus]